MSAAMAECSMPLMVDFMIPPTERFAHAGIDYNGTAVTEHPLGAEIWAYVPMNLLPHLKWLTDPNYTHVYYVDGKPKVFDAKIFTADSDHPGGWGTVLVVGMRFGGGAMTVDTAGRWIEPIEYYTADNQTFQFCIYHHGYYQPGGRTETSGRN